MFSALISVLIVSLVSFIGVFTLAIKEEKLNKILLTLVGFSVGGLLGGAVFHLLPEAVEEMGFGKKLGFCFLAGVILFFVLEKFIRWRHCHIPTSGNHPHPLGYMNLVGDAVHNFIDGTIIAAAYLVSLPLGLTTTLAVILHEVPQEIGDFGVLLHGGFTKKRALIFNFLSALFAVLGCLMMLVFHQIVRDVSLLMIPLAAGGFVYIAGSDLIPELHRETSAKKSLWQFLAIIFGIILMFALRFLE